MNQLERWGKIPVFLRWLFLFPIYLFFTFIVGIFIRIAVLAVGLPSPVFHLVFPPIIAVYALHMIYHLAPAIKLKLLIAFIALRSLLIPLLVNGFYQYQHSQGMDIVLSWSEGWDPFIGEILTLIASIWLYKYLKKNLHGRTKGVNT